MEGDSAPLQPAGQQVQAEEVSAQAMQEDANALQDGEKAAADAAAGEEEANVPADAVSKENGLDMSVHSQEQARKEQQVEGEVKKPGVIEIRTHHDENEVIEKLFAKPDLGSVQKEASSLFGWMSSQSQTFLQKATPYAEKLKSVAEAGGKEFFSKVVGEGSSDEANKLPWEDSASRQYADAIKERILGLSRDSKTFLVPPPEAVDFVLEEKYLRQGMADVMMSADPELKKQKSELVPKEVDETAFWRNYWYRVSLIKDAYHTSSNSVNDEADENVNSKVEDAEGSAKAHEEEDEVVSGWGEKRDDGLDLNDNAFDMLDDDELLASVGLDLEDDDETGVVDEEVARKIEEQLHLDDDDEVNK